MKELGLQRAYSKDDAVYKYIKKLISLPFLPYRHISPMFLRLQAEAHTELLQNLVTCIRRQSTVFLPKNWSVYQQAIRTNNDIEGCHNALNGHASGQFGLSLYSLIELLDREARLTAVTIRLASERKLKRVQRKQYRNLYFFIYIFNTYTTYSTNIIHTFTHTKYLRVTPLIITLLLHALLY